MIVINCTYCKAGSLCLSCHEKAMVECWNEAIEHAAKVCDEAHNDNYKDHFRKYEAGEISRHVRELKRRTNEHSGQ